jgi:hypothetical protein
MECELQPDGGYYRIRCLDASGQPIACFWFEKLQTAAMALAAASHCATELKALNDIALGMAYDGRLACDPSVFDDFDDLATTEDDV